MQQRRWVDKGRVDSDGNWELRIMGTSCMRVSVLFVLKRGLGNIMDSQSPSIAFMSFWLSRNIVRSSDSASIIHISHAVCQTLTCNHSVEGHLKLLVSASQLWMLSCK